MRAHFILSALLATSLACGPKPSKDKDKKDPKTKPPTTAPVTPETKPVASAPATASSGPTAPSLLLEIPDIASYTTKGKEIEQAPKVFTYTFEKGKSAAYQLSIRWQLKGTRETKLPTGDLSGTFSTKLKWSIKEVDEKGEALIELTYSDILAKFDAPIFQVVSGLLLAPFSKMEGKTFSMKISKEGNISELTGQDKILEEALSDQLFPADIKEQIVAAIGEKSLKQVLGQGFLAFPTKELKKGDAFERDGSLIPVPGLGQIFIKETVTLTETREIDGKQLALFSLGVFGGPNPEGGPSIAKLFGLELELKSFPEAAGFFAFDLGRGLPAEMSIPVSLDLGVSLAQADGTKTPPVDGLADVTIYVKLLE